MSNAPHRDTPAVAASPSENEQMSGHPTPTIDLDAGDSVSFAVDCDAPVRAVTSPSVTRESISGMPPPETPKGVS